MEKMMDAYEQFARHIICEAYRSKDWYVSRVKPARNPRITLPLANDILKDASRCGLDPEAIYLEHLEE